MVGIVFLVGAALVRDASRPYMKICRKAPEMLALNLIAKRARHYAELHGTYPKGRSATLPPWTCCPQKCGVLPAQAWAADPIWAALGVSIDRLPLQSQLAYESVDGASFRVVATADLDCDGTSIEYRLDGRFWDGKPTTSITKPLPSSD